MAAGRAMVAVAIRGLSRGEEFGRAYFSGAPGGARRAGSTGKKACFCEDAKMPRCALSSAAHLVAQVRVGVDRGGGG